MRTPGRQGDKARALLQPWAGLRLLSLTPLASRLVRGDALHHLGYSLFKVSWLLGLGMHTCDTSTQDTKVGGP